MCIPWSANSAVRCTPFDACLFTCPPSSVSLLRAAELRRSKRKQAYHSWSQYICASIHVSGESLPLQTCDAARLWGRLPTFYPHPSGGEPVGIWWRPVNLEHQLSRDHGRLSSWRQEFNEMVCFAHAWLPLALSTESITSTEGLESPFTDEEMWRIPQCTYEPEINGTEHTVANKYTLPNNDTLGCYQKG